MIGKMLKVRWEQNFRRREWFLVSFEVSSANKGKRAHHTTYAKSNGRNFTKWDVSQLNEFCLHKARSLGHNSPELIAVTGIVHLGKMTISEWDKVNPK